jgi:hypothetical protein
MIPPASRMGPLTEDELQQRLAASAQVREYAQDVDRQSAREMLEQRAANDSAAAAAAATAAAPAAAAPARPRHEEPGMMEKVLKSSLTRSVATQITRGLMGALLGTSSRGRRRGGILW